MSAAAATIEIALDAAGDRRDGPDGGDDAEGDHGLHGEVKAVGVGRRVCPVGS